MSRHRITHPSRSLDAATAEHLLGGASLDDLPEEHRPVGELLAAASGPATPDELEGSAAAAATFVAAHHASRRPQPRTRSVASLVLTAVVLVATAGTAVAATQGALPGPVQRAAHAAFGAVGISVPGSGTTPEVTIAPRDDATAPASTAGITPSPAATQSGAAGASGTPAGGAGTSAGGSPGASADATAPANTDAPAGVGVAPGNSGGAAQPDPSPGNGSTPNANPNANPNASPNGKSNGKSNGPPSEPPGQAKKKP